MVDWDRVEELRSKEWDWDRIARDPKVGFHADSAAGDPGRALRALYHRNRAQIRKKKAESSRKVPTLQEKEHRWTLLRVGYLLVPLVGVWTAIAFVVPSPVGLLLPAIPYLALILAGVAVLLLYTLWRTTGAPRWSSIYRGTVLAGVVLGLVVAGMIGLMGALIFGCPFLPPSSTLSSEPGGTGWTHANAGAWQDGGKPVLFFSGAEWCPYCSASSWAIWKAANAFGTTSGNTTAYSYGSPEPAPHTPEMILANTQLGPRNGNNPAISLEVSEYVGSADAVAPVPSGCFQLAYVTAYSGGAVPFVVVNGQYVHAGNSLVNPTDLSSWAGSGAATVERSVATETGAPWNSTGALTIQTQAGWIIAYLVKSMGASVPTLKSEYKWSNALASEVWSDLNQTS